jgi:hypothetical protein
MIASVLMMTRQFFAHTLRRKRRIIGRHGHPARTPDRLDDVPKHGIQPCVGSIISSHDAHLLQNVSMHTTGVGVFTRPGSRARSLRARQRLREVVAEFKWVVDVPFDETAAAVGIAQRACTGAMMGAIRAISRLLRRTKIAAMLNVRRVPTGTGGTWTAVQVGSIMSRAGVVARVFPTV